MQGKPTVMHGLLDGGMLFQHVDGLLDVELGDADGAGIVVG
jgi:hypothetical protein